MADMEQNLSLADALTEPPPQIEEEVKRDFMASLEAEKFDDVIGEKVGKTDYVPLLDDDEEPKAGTPEAKAKPRTENLPQERPSAPGPATVVENGDHGLKGSRQEPPGKIMEEQMTYKEFLGHNDTWTVDDRSRSFESKLGLKPMDVAETFPTPREDMVSDLLLHPEDMMGFGQYFGAPKESHGPYGTAEFSEPPSLGFTPPIVTGFEPLSFLGPGLNPSQAASSGPITTPQDFWFGTRHLAEGQFSSPFFEIPEAHQVPGVEMPHHHFGNEMVFPGELSPREAEQMVTSAVPPAFGDAGPTSEELMGFEPSLGHGLLPPKTVQAGFPETPGSKAFKSEEEDIIVLAATSGPMPEKPEEESQCLPAPKEKDPCRPSEDPTAINLPSQKAEGAQPPRQEGFTRGDLEGSFTQHEEKGREDGSKLALIQQMQEVTSQLPPGQKAEEPPLSPGQKAEEPPLSPGQKAEEPPLSPGQKAEEPLPSPVWKADTPLSPTQPSEKAVETKIPLSPLLAKPDAKSSQPVEILPGQEQLDRQPPLGASPEKPKELSQPTLTQPGEHLPELADSMGPELGKKPHVEFPKSFVDSTLVKTKEPAAHPVEDPSAAKQPLEQEEEVKASAGVPSSEDAPALPVKDLLPSLEKKAKPLAGATPKPTAAKAKPGTAAVTPTKRPASAPLSPSKRATAGPSATATTAKRPSTGMVRPSTLSTREVKPKVTEAKSLEKRASLSKPSSATTPRPSPKAKPLVPAAAGGTPGLRTGAVLPPKKPSAVKAEVKPTEAKKMAAKAPAAEPSRPKSAPASTTASPALPATLSARPRTKPATPRLPGAAGATADAKKPALPPKTSLASKPARPATSTSVPDLKNIRSKIGSTDNIKYQPGGGKAKLEKKSSMATRNSEPNGVSKSTPNKSTLSKEGLVKSPNGKVQILSKKANYSHVQSKCGSKDNIKHVPGGGNVQNVPKSASGNKSQPSTNPKPSPGCTNVQIQNKKIDFSKVSSKCGSKTNIKHKPGGGDVKIENQKLNFKEKAQAKVGSLDNVGHVPAGGTVKTEGGKEAAPENGAPPSGSSAPQENGAGPLAPAQGSGDQREIQCFVTHIQETN